MKRTGPLHRVGWKLSERIRRDPVNAHHDYIVGSGATSPEKEEQLETDLLLKIVPEGEDAQEQPERSYQESKYCSREKPL